MSHPGGQDAVISDVERARNDMLNTMIEFERLIVCHNPTSAAVLSKERVKLVRAVDRYIFCIGKGLSSAQPQFAECGNVQPWHEAHKSLIAFRLRYSGHISHWSGSAIGPGWKEYTAACHMLLKEMRQHLDCVKSYPTLTG